LGHPQGQAQRRYHGRSLGGPFERLHAEQRRQRDHAAATDRADGARRHRQRDSGSGRRDRSPATAEHGLRQAGPSHPGAHDSGQSHRLHGIPSHPAKPYRVVYIGQGCGANRAAKNNTYPLFIEAQGGTEQAVYVAVSVPDNDANPGCYDNNSGPQSQEWEAFELMHTLVEGTFCVDNNQIFVTGYSTGGWLANMWGCYFGGVPDPPRKFAPNWAIRGHAAVTGSLPPNQPRPCSGKSAGFWLHDAGDTGNRIATNIAAINLTLETNGCMGNYEDGPKKPWAPAADIAGLQGEICQEYTGCPAEVAAKYPIVFCTTNGLGHGDQSTSAIPAITKFFDLMKPTP
jgi:hypothetical protein